MARSEPTSAPVCVSAARAAASERPTLMHTTGLFPAAHRASAAANSSGRRIVSRKSPMARVCSSAATASSRSAASVTASPPLETTQRKPIRPPRESRASPIEPDWQIAAT